MGAPVSRSIRATERRGGCSHDRLKKRIEGEKKEGTAAPGRPFRFGARRWGTARRAGTMRQAMTKGGCPTPTGSGSRPADTGGWRSAAMSRG
jgi:hypothetical protein